MCKTILTKLAKIADEHDVAGILTLREEELFGVTGPGKIELEA
jgi:hypothetical protein